MARINKNEKTNVMRILDSMKIPYSTHCYLDTGAVSGIEVASILELNPERVYKTLVTVGKSGEHFVFMIPVAEELDLKLAAKSVGEKAIEMLPQKQLLPLTGYVHGGCSPIGMKKQFFTVIHEAAMGYQTIIFSAGKIGFQVEMSPVTLSQMFPCNVAYIIDRYA